MEDLVDKFKGQELKNNNANGWSDLEIHFLRNKILLALEIVVSLGDSNN